MKILVDFELLRTALSDGMNEEKGCRNARNYGQFVEKVGETLADTFMMQWNTKKCTLLNVVVVVKIF